MSQVQHAKVNSNTLLLSAKFTVVEHVSTSEYDFFILKLTGLSGLTYPEHCVLPVEIIMTSCQ